MELMPPMPPMFNRNKPPRRSAAQTFGLNLEAENSPPDEFDVVDNPVNMTFTEGAAMGQKQMDLSAPSPALSGVNRAAPPKDSIHLSGPVSAKSSVDQSGDVSAPVFRGGFENYMDTQLMRTGGTLVYDGKSRQRGARFSEGRFKGMTMDEARDQVRNEYARMSDSQRKQWEDRANMLDVRSERERQLLSRPEYKRGGFV